MKYPAPLLLVVSILVMSGCATSPTGKAPASDHDAIVKSAGEKVLRWEFDEALADLNRVIAEDPQNASAYSWRAGLYLRKRNFEAALADYDTALALKPTAGNYLNRAQIKSDKKNWDGALRDIEAALKIDPKSDLAYSLRAGIKTRRKDHAGAIADYDYALRLLESSPTIDYLRCMMVYNDRGEAKESNDNYDGAIADFTKIIELQRKYPAAIQLSLTPYYKRGRTKYWKGDYEDSIRDLTQSIAAEPEKAGAYRYRGMCKQSLDDHDGAISDFDACLRLMADESAFSSRGIARFIKGDLRDALDDLNAALRIDSTSTLALKYRGRVKLGLGDYRGALLDYSSALKIDPNYTTVCFYMGISYQMLLDYPAALSCYEKSFTRPVSDTIYSRINRGILLERTGKSSVSAELSPYIASWPGEWQKSLGLYFTKKISEGELLRRATAAARDLLPAQKCEAFYYIGISHLLAGEKLEAKEAFEKCVEVEGTIVTEHLLAVEELKNL